MDRDPARPDVPLHAELFDIPRIEKKVKANDHQPGYDKLIFQTTLVMAASFFISAAANFFLAQ